MKFIRSALAYTIGVLTLVIYGIFYTIGTLAGFIVHPIIDGIRSGPDDLIDWCERQVLPR